MDPTLGEQQEDSSSQKQQQRQGILSRGINTLNNLRGANRLLSNPLGKIGSRVAAQTALRGLTAFLGSTSGVWIPIAIAILSVFVFTLIIVGFGGAPPSATNDQSANPASAGNITPTPAP